MHRRRVLRDVAALAVVVGLLGAAYFLPPDTSLAQVKRAGVLRACVPTEYRPLVTGNADAPGVDVEILQEVASRLGVRLSLNRQAAIGQDWNPRNWRLTRAQCQVVAGGIVSSNTTRSFMDTTPSHAETGWVLIAGGSGEKRPLDGSTVGFYAGLTGLDRISLSRFLRAQGARVVTVHSRRDIAEGLRSGRFDFGVSEALLGRTIAGEEGWHASLLPDELPRYPLAFGLWRGDLTLKRAVVDALADMERDGSLSDIWLRYEVAPVADLCSACS